MNGIQEYINKLRVNVRKSIQSITDDVKQVMWEADSVRPAPVRRTKG